MSTWHSASGRKPLSSIAHQQNNPTLHNKRTTPATPTANQKPSLRKKVSLNAASNEKRFKSTAVEGEKQLTEKKLAKYNDTFERGSEEQERQQQSCQNYFLRRTVMALYRLFQRMQRRWNLFQLNYSQLLTIMRQLGYLKEEESSEKASNDLKQCFWLWINITQGSSFNLINLLISLFCLEHLHPDTQLITDIVTELSKGIAKFPFEEVQEQTHFIFLVKKEQMPFKEGILQLEKMHMDRIENNLKDLRLNKLMKGCSHEQKEEHIQTITLSKKSSLLAEGKRLKIIKQIKQSEPQVTHIQLHHLLSYKAEKCNKGKHKVTEKEQKRYISVVLPKTTLIKPNNQVRNQAQPKKVVFEPQQQPQIKRESNIERRESQQSFQFFSSEELFADRNDPQKQQIIDELEWQAIPKPPQQVSMQHQLLKEDFLLEPPLTHTFGSGQKGKQDKQRKRKEFIDLPILFVDVNIEEGRKERIVIYQGDQARDLAIEFGKKHGLNSEMVERLEGLLELQIGSILTKIEEANQEDCSQLY